MTAVTRTRPARVRSHDSCVARIYWLGWRSKNTAVAPQMAPVTPPVTPAPRPRKYPATPVSAPIPMLITTIVKIFFFAIPIRLAPTRILAAPGTLDRTPMRA